MNPRYEERLGAIDVADSGHDALIEKSAGDRLVRPFEPFDDAPRVRAEREGIRTEPPESVPR